MSKGEALAIVIGVVLLCGIGVIALLVLNVNAERRKRDAARAVEEITREEALAAEQDAAIPEMGEFGEPRRPTAEELTAFTALFDAVGQAQQRGDRVAVRAKCDSLRMLEELLRLNAAANHPGGRAGFRREVLAADGPCIVDKDARWTRTDIRWVRPSPKQDEAMLVVIHHDSDGERVTRRWWVVRRLGVWKLYDASDRFFEVRQTRAWAFNLALDKAQGVGEQNTAYDAVLRGWGRLNRQDRGDEAERWLAPGRGISLPPLLAALRETLEARIAAIRGDMDRALRHLDAAEAIHGGVPAIHLTRAEVYNGTGRFDEALAAVAKYNSIYGADAASSTAEGVALAGLKRNSEAAIAYRAALDDAPDTSEALDGLRRVLPDADKSELTDRIRKARDPRKLCDQAVLLARAAGDDMGVAALLAGLRKAQPDAP